MCPFGTGNELRSEVSVDAFQRGRGRGRGQTRARRVRERGCGRAWGMVQGHHQHRPPVAPASSIGGCLADATHASHV